MTDHENRCQSPSLAWTVRIVASVASGLLLAMAVFVIWRRIIGALQAPLSGAGFLFLGLMFLGPAVVLRHSWRLAVCPTRLLTVEAVWTLFVPTVSLLAILIAISVPGTSPIGVVVVGLFWGLGEVMVYRPRKWLARLEPSLVTGATVGETAVEPSEPLAEEFSRDVDRRSQDVERLSQEKVSQQLIRCRTEEGRDCVKGWLRVDIPAGHRTHSVHLAFCPSFQQSPFIEVHQEDGPKSRVKMVQSLPYGAHFEVKLPQPCSTDQTLSLRFQAVGE